MDQDKDLALVLKTFELDETQNKYFVQLSEKKRQKVSNKTTAMATGAFATAPIICKGYQKCPFKSHCPIPEVENGKIIVGPDSDYPINSSCVLESSYIQQKTVEYIQYLVVDIRNPIEMSIVSELALIDLYKTRAQMILSSGDREGQGLDFLRIDVTQNDNGNGDDRQTIMSSSTQLHPVFNAIDTLEKRRDRLLTQLVETRRSKIDVAVKMGKRREESNMVKELRSLRELLAGQKDKLPSESELLISIGD